MFVIVVVVVVVVNIQRTNDFFDFQLLCVDSGTTGTTFRPWASGKSVYIVSHTAQIREVVRKGAPPKTNCRLWFSLCFVDIDVECGIYMTDYPVTPPKFNIKYPKMLGF